MSVTLAALGPLVKKELSVLVMNALLRPGVENELAMVKSLIALLADNGRIRMQDGGQYAKELRFQYASGSTAEWFESGDVPNATSNNQYKETNVKFAKAWENIKIDTFDQNASKGGQLHEEASIWVKQTAEALKNLVSLLEQGLLANNGSIAKEVLGIPFWISKTSVIGTGLLDQATETWLQSVIKDASGALTIAMIYEVRDTLSDERGAEPDVILTSRKQYRAYVNLIRAQSNAIINYEPMSVGDTEFESISHGGVRIVSIPTYPNTRMDFVTWKYFELVLLMIESKNENAKTMTEQETYNGYPFGMKPKQHATHDDGAEVFFYPQFVCSAPWKQGAIINLT